MGNQNTALSKAMPTDIGSGTDVPAEARRGQLWLALVCVCVTGAGNSAIASVLPALARRLDISEASVGFISGVAPLVFVLAAPLWGHVADRLGPKIVLLMGMSGYALGTAAFAGSAAAGLALWMSGYVLIVALGAGQVVNSALGAGTTPAAVAVAAYGSTADKRAGAIASISAAYGIGMMLGPAIAAALASVSLIAPHLLLAFASLSAGLAVLLYGPVGVERRVMKTAQVLRPTDRRIRPFLAVAAGLYAALACLYVVLGFAVQDRLQLAATNAAQLTGTMFTLLGFSALIALLVLVRRKVGSPLVCMRAGAIAVVIGMIGLSVASSVIMFGFACSAIGLGLGLCGPTTSAACSLALKAEEQGSGAGWMTSARSVGSIAGAWLGGLLYTVDPQLPFMMGIAVGFGITALIVLSPRAFSAESKP